MAETATFAKAIRMAETGDDERGYNAVRGLVRNQARLLGAYGFPSDEWPTLAEDAGYPGARWQDRRAQDAVAEATFERLYRKYNDWRLVATAWKAGEEAADRIAAEPRLIDRDGLGPLKEYVGMVMRHAGQSVREKGVIGPSQPQPETPDEFPLAFDDLAPSEGYGRPQGTDEVEAVLRRRLISMRNAARAQAAQSAQSAAPESPPGAISESQQSAPAPEGRPGRLGLRRKPQQAAPAPEPATRMEPV